jgi:hypothetical protein
VLTGANVFEELVEAIEPIKRPGRGRPRKRPEKLHAEKDYEAKKCRQALRKRAYQEPHSQEGQRQQRAAGATSVGGVERTLAWVSRYRRLAVRYERRADIDEAFLHLGCSLICLSYLSS